MNRYSNAKEEEMDFYTKGYRMVLRILFIKKVNNADIIQDLKIGENWLKISNMSQKLKDFGRAKHYSGLGRLKMEGVFS